MLVQTNIQITCCRILPSDPASHDGCNRRHRNNITNMGFSVRSKGFRLTTYIKFDGAANAPVGGNVWALAHPVTEELYDHRGHPSRDAFHNWGYIPTKFEKDAYEESFVKCNAVKGCVSKEFQVIRNFLRSVLKDHIREGVPSA
jgi:hypothetical protein